MDKKHTGLLISTCLLSTLTLLLAFSIVFISYIHNTELKSMNETISKKNEEINEKNIKLENMRAQLQKYESDETYDYVDEETKILLHIISYMRSKGDYDEDQDYGYFYGEHACIVTPEGERYHKINCYHIANIEKYRIMNIKAAESYGYEKCSDCFK